MNHVTNTKLILDKMIDIANKKPVLENMRNIVNKKLTLDNMRNMTTDEIVKLYRSGYRINVSDGELSCLSYVYDHIINKKIDESRIQHLIDPGDSLPTLPNNYGWLRVSTTTPPIMPDTLVFIDISDATYDYGIIIRLHGDGSTPETHCISNPITECAYVTSDAIPSQCVFGMTIDKEGNTISYVVPQNIMDKALNSLPIVSSTGSALMIAGILTLGTMIMFSSK